MFISTDVCIWMTRVEEYYHAWILPQLAVMDREKSVEAFDTAQLILDVLHARESGSLRFICGHDLLSTLKSKIALRCLNWAFLRFIDKWWRQRTHSLLCQGSQSFEMIHHTRLLLFFYLCWTAGLDHF